jgi:NADH-quinone oxidoreductase subunit H
MNVFSVAFYIFLLPTEVYSIVPAFIDTLSLFITSISQKCVLFLWLFIGTVLQILSFVIPLLLAIAFLTLLERKILASVQGRVGPNFVGPRGILQPIADGVKLLFKEVILPLTSSHTLFIFAPIFSFFLSLSNWAVMTFDYDYGAFTDLNLGVLYIFMVSSLSVYALILAGWSSNSRYALLGGLRAAAQMISYEVSIGLIILNVVICVGSLNLSDIVYFQRHVCLIFPLLPMFLIFFVSALAETNRSPFDLPEAEGELVAGYNVEYSSITFALFFLAEYGNIIFMSVFSTVLFLGGWVHGFHFFLVKIVIMVCFFVWVRAAFPRYRYDQLMQIGWKLFLPLSFSYVLFTASILYAFDALPF